MFASCVSRVPPGNSQLRPLCSKIGHARTPTNTIIVITQTPTSNETAPSTRSARLSDQGWRSHSITAQSHPRDGCAEGVRTEGARTGGVRLEASVRAGGVPNSSDRHHLIAEGIHN